MSVYWDLRFSIRAPQKTLTLRQGHSIHLKLGSPTQSRDEEHLDLYFSVEGIEHLFETFKTQPVIITQELREMPYGWEFYISDPDGYILGFIENE